MRNQKFKNAILRVDGKIFFTELSEEQKKRIPDYIEVLRTAYGSDVPRPSFSNYFSREAIGIVGGPKVPAGNIEYGVCKALHGEEAAVAAFRAIYRRKPENEKVILGIIADQPEEVPALCGNCRDILLDEFGSDFEIVAGSPEFEVTIVINMKNYLFSNFEEGNLPCANIIIMTSIYKHIMKYHKEVTKKIENDVYSGDLHPERKYYAMINTLSRDNYFGALDIMCDYHPIYPLRDAIRQIRRAGRENTSFVINGVYILFEGLKNKVMPHVMYKDRQHLLEFNIEVEQFCQKEINPPVFLFDSRDGQLVNIYKTTIKQWLPIPFLPLAFDNNFQK